MKTITLNGPFHDLSDPPEPIPDSHMGKLLAQALIGTSQGPIIKHYDWALALHRGQPISLDNSDIEYLKKFIENSPILNILPKRQILDAFSNGQETCTIKATSAPTPNRPGV